MQRGVWHLQSTARRRRAGGRKFSPLLLPSEWKRQFTVKWVFLAVIFGGVLPLSGWLRQNPNKAPTVWVLFGLLPFILGSLHLTVAPISWAGWPGYVQGAEISALDALAIAVYFSLPRGGRHSLPFRLSMALYFIAVLLSALQAQVPIASLLYAWQLARMFLLYAVVAKACADDRFAPAVLKGMAIGLCLEVPVEIWERFVKGEVQATGSFGHENLTGLISHFAVFPLLALFLGTRSGRLPPVGLLSGMVIAVLGASRATLGLAGIGYVELFLLSAWRQWTPRKANLLLMGLGVAALVTPFAWLSLEHRFAAKPLSQQYDERAAFDRAASMMVSDHPLGVGANQYVVVANTQNYNTRAGVVWTSGSANVHNVYRLVQAETGYFGLFAFVLLLSRPLITAFICGWRARTDWRGDLLLGFGTALLVVYLQSFYEWVFVAYPTEYLFAIDSGMIAGLAQQLGYWGRVRVPSKRLLSGRETEAAAE